MLTAQGWTVPRTRWSRTGKQGLRPRSQLTLLELKAAAVVSPLSFCKNAFYSVGVLFFFLKRTFCCELAKPVLDAHTEPLTICSTCQRDFFGVVFFPSAGLPSRLAPARGRPAASPREAVGPRDSEGSSPRAKPCSLRLRRGLKRPLGAREAGGSQTPRSSRAQALADPGPASVLLRLTTDMERNITC